MSIERQLSGLLRATTELSVELRLERDRLKVINAELTEALRDCIECLVPSQFPMTFSQAQAVLAKAGATP